MDNITTGGDSRVTALEARVEQTLARIYGPDTQEYNQLLSLDMTRYWASFIDDGDDGCLPGTSVAQFQYGLSEGRQPRRFAKHSSTCRSLRQ